MKRHEQSDKLQKEIERIVRNFRTKLVTSKIIGNSEFPRIFGEQLAERLIINYEDFKFSGDVALKELEKAFKQFLRRKGKMEDFQEVTELTPKEYINTHLFDKCIPHFEESKTPSTLQQLQEALRKKLKVTESSESEEEEEEPTTSRRSNRKARSLSKDPEYQAPLKERRSRSPSQGPVTRSRSKKTKGSSSKKFTREEGLEEISKHLKKTEKILEERGFPDYQLTEIFGTDFEERLLLRFMNPAQQAEEHRRKGTKRYGQTEMRKKMNEFLRDRDDAKQFRKKFHSIDRFVQAHITIPLLTTFSHFDDKGLIGQARVAYNYEMPKFMKYPQRSYVDTTKEKEESPMDTSDEESTFRKEHRHSGRKTTVTPIRRSSRSHSKTPMTVLKRRSPSPKKEDIPMEYSEEEDSTEKSDDNDKNDEEYIPPRSKTHAVQQQQFRQKTKDYPERHAKEQQKYQKITPGYHERHAAIQQKYQKETPGYHEYHAAKEKQYQTSSKTYSARHVVIQQQYRQRTGYAKETSAYKQRLLNLTGRNLSEDEQNEFLQILNPDIIEEKHYLGKRNYRCPFCGALHFNGKHNCCGFGRITLAPLPKRPEPLEHLFKKNPKGFLNKVLEYNCICACGSNQYHREQVAKHGAQVMKVRGSVHHFTSCVEPWNENKPRFGNFYVFRGEEAVEQRMEQSIFSDLDEEVVAQLTKCMEDYYPYAKFYWQMGNLIKEEERRKNQPSKIIMRIVDARSVDKEKLQQHVKTYVAPPIEGGDFIAAFISADDIQNFDYPGINVYRKLSKGAPPMPVFPWMSHINSLLYPLLFPRGEGGWTAHRYPIEEDKTKGFAQRLREYAATHRGEVKLWNFNLHDVEGFYEHHPLEGDPNIEMEEVEEPEEYDANKEELYKDLQHTQTFSSTETPDPEGLAVERNIIVEERNGQLYPVRIAEGRDIPNPINTEKMILDPLDAEHFLPIGKKEDDFILDENPHGQTEEELNEQLDKMAEELFTPPPSSSFDKKTEGKEEVTAISKKNVVSKKREFVSLREWAMYMCQDRPWEFSRFSSAGKLSQLWIIDICTRIYHFRTQALRKFHSQYTSSTRKEFIKAMQRRMDAIALKAGTIPRSIGCISSVPSTVPGSPRYLMEKFENACVMTNELGHADLFITFTANMKWPEITENLRPGQRWCDDPFKVNEVFVRKLDEFFNDVLGEPIDGNKSQRKPGMFGVVRWMTYSIEFQARGPPHAHIIISLLQHVRTATEVDKICQAYIPKLPDKRTVSDEEYESKERLRNLVTSLMIHRPCNETPEAYCREGNPEYWGMCRKGFPKEFSNVTRLDDRDYPHLRRPDDGERIRVKSQGKEKDTWADNRWVVATNFYLLSKYECHINIEIISSLLVLRYIFKYVFKGFDRVLVEAITNLAGDSASADMMITGHVFHPKSLQLPEGVLRARNKEVEKRLTKEEVKLYDSHGQKTLVYDENYFVEDMRCITPCEAAWEIAEYKRCDSMYTVIPLYVHMPHEEPVVIEPGKEVELYQHILEEGVQSRLNAWFELNKQLLTQGEEDKLLTFKDVPTHFIYEYGKFRPRKRMSEFIRGHVKQVNPKNLELFAIRLLSMNLKGITSFDHLRTFNGQKCKSFAEAAKKHELMNDQEEWKNAIEEASDKTPRQLRRLFSTILIFCAVIDPLDLWRNVKKYLVEDRKDWTDEMKESHALYHIASILRIHGTSLDKYFLPEIDRHYLKMIPSSDLIDEAKEDTMTKDEARKVANALVKDLHPGQRKVFNTIVDSIMSEEKKSFFISGQAGSGKTYLYRTLYHHLRCKGLKVLSVAHTGVAAMLLPYGSTAHSAFKIPLTTEENMHSKIKLEQREADYLRSVDVVLWDEAPMTDKRIFEAVNEVFLKLHEADPSRGKYLFAGIPFIMGGDFRQTLPIVPGIRGATVLDYTIRKSDMWNKLKILELTANLRTGEYQKHSDWLLQVGNGTANKDTNIREEFQEVEIPESMLVESEDAVIERLYGRKDDPNKKILDTNIVEKTSILTVDNKTTFELNRKILNLLDSDEHVYKSIDVYDETKGFAALDPEFYNASTPSGLPPHKLELKVGAIVMLLRNINVRKGLVNGTRIRITELRHNVIIGIPISQEKKKSPEEVILHRMRLTTATNVRELAFSRWQFPVRLAFAITINKAQGQTLEHVGIVLRTPVFAHGQFYVAFSRGNNPLNIVVFNAAENPRITINVVHRDALIIVPHI